MGKWITSLQNAHNILTILTTEERERSGWDLERRARPRFS